MRSEACWARVAVSGQNRSVSADNAAAESFLGTLKKELVNRNDYQVRLSIRYWIEAWYKPLPAPFQRRTSAGDRILRPPRHYALEGISLETLCELGKAQGLTVEERPLSLYDLVNADEVMITSTSSCALPVVSLDGISLPGGGKRLPQDARAVAGVGAVRFRATSRRDRPRGVSPQGPCDPGSDRTTCRCITRRERRRRDIVWGMVSQRVPPARKPPA